VAGLRPHARYMARNLPGSKYAKAGLRQA